jgi:hypothetical protein
MTIIRNGELPTVDLSKDCGYAMVTTKKNVHPLHLPPSPTPLLHHLQWQ